MSDRVPDLIATASETVGPFFHFGIATDDTLGCVADRSVTGEHIALRFRITDGDAAAVPDALVEIWQVDADGTAARQPAAGERLPFSGFGRLPTSADGTCEFQTVRPGRVPDGQGGRQAAHINVCLFARGLLRHLHTRVYFAGDPALTEDAVLAMVPADRRGTLVARPDPSHEGRWLFDLRLQGPDETVFFDV
jgi:protocatechuate 3,4-dioxygenase alpha subunit